MTVVHIDDLHSQEMIDDELAICLGELAPVVTLGGFMRLSLCHSPYVFGGEVSDKDVSDALLHLENPEGLAKDKFDAVLRQELAAVFRAFEVIIQDETSSSSSNIPIYGPEWMTNILAAAADAVPSLSLDVMLNKMPMVLLIHLVGAAHRKNGGTTRRPVDAAALFENEP